MIAAAAVVGGLRWQARGTPIQAGFWFDVESYGLSRASTSRLGGPLSDGEVATIQRIARAELAQAFAGLRIDISDRRDGFWRVQVLNALDGVAQSIYRGRPSGAGESISLGPLGGRGTVAFRELAEYAVDLAPPGASRETMVEGIGRGIGRAAVHEFGHQITGQANHDDSDIDSYEYPYSRRASQYYGELHWTLARGQLLAKLGK